MSRSTVAASLGIKFDTFPPIIFRRCSDGISCVSLPGLVFALAFAFRVCSFTFSYLLFIHVTIFLLCYSKIASALRARSTDYPSPSREQWHVLKESSMRFDSNARMYVY